MSKFDKKVISFIIIMVMMLTSVMPVISKAATGESVIKDPILAEEFYDENGDGIISKEEVAAIGYIYISAGVKDLTGLEYATGLYEMSYEYSGNTIDFSPIPKENIFRFYLEIPEGVTKVNFDFLKEFPNVKYFSIWSKNAVKLDLTGLEQYTQIEQLELENIEVPDFKALSKFTHLKGLTINSEEGTTDVSGIEKLTQLDHLCIYKREIKNASAIGKLTNLFGLTLSGCTGIGDAGFLANNTKLNYISISESDLSSIAFVKNLKELESISFYNTNVTDISPLVYATSLNYVSLPTDANIKSISSIIKFADYRAYIGEKVYVSTTISGITYTHKWDYTSSNENVVSVNQLTGEIKAIAPGEATITATYKDDQSLVKTFKITVSGIDSNQPAGSNMESKQISENFILKANGELWRLQAKEAKAEKIDTNVKNYVYSFVYNEKEEAFNYTLTQKADGTVKYSFNGVETQLKNAKEIYNNGYLSNDGVYYTITAKGTWEKVTDNVKKLVGSYIVKNDGKTYTVTNKLVCGFEIVAAKDNIVVDKNKAVWKIRSESEPEKIGENFKEFAAGEYNSVYKTTDGAIYRDTEKTEYLFEGNLNTGNYLRIDKSNNLLLNDTVILTKVISANMTVTYENYPIEYIMIREDGSTWALYLNGEPKLEKIIEQKEGIFIANKSVKAKPIDSFEEAITGFDIKKLDVASVKSNFNSKYSVKIYKNDKELTGTAKVSTGSVIELYNAKGELAKTYTALVYGDVTGTGNPSAKDALAIIKNKTGKVAIKDNLYLEAARVTENTRKTAGVPNAADALAIVKSKLGKYTISI